MLLAAEEGVGKHVRQFDPGFHSDRIRFTGLAGALHHMLPQAFMFSRLADLQLPPGLQDFLFQGPQGLLHLRQGRPLALGESTLGQPDTVVQASGQDASGCQEGIPFGTSRSGSLQGDGQRPGLFTVEPAAQLVQSRTAGFLRRPAAPDRKGEHQNVRSVSCFAVAYLALSRSVISR